ncbi:hypothetical protein ACF0H5_022070 [Mactra antiquata]
MAKFFKCPRKKGKIISPVWQHYGMKLKEGVVESVSQAENEQNLDTDFVYCLHCGKRYRNHQATTTMRWHLGNEHRNISFKEDLPDKKQQTLKCFVSTPAKKLSLEKTSCLDDKLLTLITDKMLLLSIEDHSSFVDFIRELEPAYKVPGRKLVVKKLKEKYQQGVKILSDLVADCSSVALTHDSWTSIKTESFDTVTAHFIDNNWVLHSAVLRTTHFSGSHTGENISKHLAETIKVWKIQDPTFVTDNAANERKAIRELGYLRIGCYGHRLNLVVKKGLENPKAKNLIDKGRSIVTFFHTSTNATEVLLSSQSSATPLHVIQDVCTRWNSSLDMLVRLEKLFPVLTKIIVDGALGKRTKELETRMYTYSERDDIVSLISVLEPFKNATEMLSSDTIPTHGLILPALKKLNKVLSISSDDIDMIKDIKTVMNTQLQDRTTDMDATLIACKLTPSIRHMSFSTEEEKLRAVELLNEELLKCFCAQSNNKQENPTQNTEHHDMNNNDPPLPNMNIVDDNEINDVLLTEGGELPVAKKIKLDCTLSSEEKHVKSEPTSWLDDIIFIEEINAPDNRDLAAKELNSYLMEPSVTNLSALDWWKQNHFKYPKMALLAKKYLAIPASSVSSERIFSLTGNIISKKGQGLVQILWMQWCF